MERRSELTLSLRADGSVGVDYLLDSADDSLKLRLPNGNSWDVVVEDGEGALDAKGVVVLPNPSNRIRMTLLAEPPERRRAGVYPLAFAVEGRGVGIYLPYLLPEGCWKTAVHLDSRTGMAAVVDGAYRRLERRYEVSDVGGFVLLGTDLTPDSIIQSPKSLPVWLRRAIGDSYQKAQTDLVGILGGHRMHVPLLVDFSAIGGGHGGSNGGDVGGDTIRLWFRGHAWEQETVALRERMNGVLVHELVHWHRH